MPNINDLFEVKARILEVRNEQITRIVIAGQIIDIHVKDIEPVELLKPELPKLDIPTSIIKPPEIKQKDRGIKIGNEIHNVIYSNVLNDIKQAISQNKSQSELIDIMTGYYPQCQYNSNINNVNKYKRWLKKESSKRTIAVMQATKSKEATEEKDKGQIIAELSNNKIYSNVLNDLKDAIDRGIVGGELVDIIAGYYPHSIHKSHKVYLSAYKRYIGGEVPDVFGIDKGKVLEYDSTTPIYDKILNEIRQGGSDIEVLRKYYPKSKLKSLERYVYSYKRFLSGKMDEPKRKRLPKEYIGRDDAYGLVRRDVYDAVKKAVSKWNFIATTKSLAEETGFAEQQVRSALHLLEKKHKIYRKYDKGKLSYHPTV